jgi:hypothetical protein
MRCLQYFSSIMVIVSPIEKVKIGSNILVKP